MSWKSVGFKWVDQLPSARGVDVRVDADDGVVVEVEGELAAAAAAHFAPQSRP
ncbi:hypothetical protein AB0M48_32580 [Lentzea sp. NPDC051208]|uniref:hypothetical protein n=1 Tax=Lentzea sp. NPDC051208 TaxID=3154642 RepID=UPI00343A79F7